MIAARRRPPHRHLRLQPAGRRARRQPRDRARRRALRRRDRRPRDAASARRSTACACRCSASTMCRTRWPPSPSRGELGIADDDDPRSARRLRRRQAPLHQDRRGRTASRVIDDYGHHPVEIAAVLKAARAGRPRGRVIAVVQPHRYTRLQTCSTSSAPASTTPTRCIVADVYAAGEAPIEGVDRDALVEGLRAPGHRHVLAARRRRATWPPLVRELAPARRPRGLPRRRQHHRLGPRPARASSRSAARMTAGRPQMARLARRACPPVARPAAARRAAGAAHLVPRRRPGRGAVPAGGRGGSRRVPRGAAADVPVHRARRRLEPPGARRRRATAW